MRRKYIQGKLRSEFFLFHFNLLQGAMVAKSLRDILIGVPSGKLNLKGYDIGPKHRRRLPDKSKFDYREISGKEWSYTLNRFVSKHQIIDRVHKRYYELVVDDETGEVLNFCDEALSDHKGHGSAKVTESCD